VSAVNLFSRRVIGRSMSVSMMAQLVADALLMADWRRGKPDELLHHLDQGSQHQASGSSGYWLTAASSAA
jgi:putative transposase